MYEYGTMAASEPAAGSYTHVEECDFDATGIEIPEPVGLDVHRYDPYLEDQLQPTVSSEEPRKSIHDMTKRELGTHGEDIAARYLYNQRGWTILARNWVNRFGEVDIIALDDDDESDTVVLVEVKTRLDLRQEGDIAPELAVGPRKLKRYKLMALNFLMDHPETKALRFDVVALTVYEEEKAHMRHLFRAHEWDEAE